MHLPLVTEILVNVASCEKALYVKWAETLVFLRALDPYMCVLKYIKMGREALLALSAT